MAVHYVPHSLVSKEMRNIINFLLNGDSVFVVEKRKVICQVVPPTQEMRVAQERGHVVPSAAETKVASVGSSKAMNRAKYRAEYDQKLAAARTKPGFNMEEFHRRHEYLLHVD